MTVLDVDFTRKPVIVVIYLLAADEDHGGTPRRPEPAMSLFAEAESSPDRVASPRLQAAE